MAKSKHKRTPKTALKLPDLEQSKSAVMNSLTSASSKRSYDHAIREFIDWYCSEPRLAFNRTVVTRYRIALEQHPYAPSTINLRLAAIRRLAYEASDCGVKLGLLVQQSIGRLFVETFTATEESLAAARMVLEAASSSNVLKMLVWRISGRVERAKTLLASMVNGDLAGVIAMIAARQLIVDGLHKIRQLAADPALRSSITTDAAVDECLFAPTTVVRQAKTSGEVGGCPFRRGSLFILGLGSASKGAANRDLVFLSQSWSRCPAEKWVPALLEGVWTRVSATLLES